MAVAIGHGGEAIVRREYERSSDSFVGDAVDNCAANGLFLRSSRLEALPSRWFDG